MDATSTVKAEIKAWEREFRAQNGRNATVEDIKTLPHITEKYKLYKKLAKEADAKTSRDKQVLEPPRTPPRRKPAPLNFAAPPAVILPKSRPVASTADVPTNNPFSPVKRKSANAAASGSSANPFLTPVKAKRAPSPEASPPPPVPELAPAAAAVSKARKRLRGEPVSPSPKPREKRRRVDALGTRPSHSRSPSPRLEEGDSFVDDSPVKAPASGKTFMPLFEEASRPVVMPSLHNTGAKTDPGNRNKAFSRAKTMPGALFGSVKMESKNARTSLAPDVFGTDTNTGIDGTTTNEKRKGKDKEQQPVDGAQKLRKKRVLPGPRGLIPGRDDLFDAPQTASGSSSAPSHGTSSSRKRSLSEATKDEKEPRATFNAWDLLPPSPPPADDSRWQKINSKGKTKAKATGKGKSKKLKLFPDAGDEENEELSAEEKAAVKVISLRGRPQSPQRTSADDTALKLDPEIRFHLRGRQTNGDSPPNSPQPETFEVDLPEEMRTMLALSPNDKDREREEEDVVKGLMKGVRKAAGEVWGPGEIGREDKESDEDVPAATEDDWEGEGTPWEIAEL